MLEIYLIQESPVSAIFLFVLGIAPSFVIDGKIYESVDSLGSAYFTGLAIAKVFEYKYFHTISRIYDIRYISITGPLVIFCHFLSQNVYIIRLLKNTHPID
jgi:hypothetical protein